jgi:hypothetical protein
MGLILVIKRRGILLMALFLIISCVTIPLVSYFSNDSYRTVTIQKGGVRIFFEYPNSYKDPANSLKENNRGEENQVILYHLYTSTPIQKVDMVFGIDIQTSGLLYPNAKNALENYLTRLKNSSYDNKFKLIERSSIDLSNVHGELAVFSVSYLPDSLLGDQLSEVRVIYLDYNNQIWNFGIEAHKELAEKAKIDFEHIIKSFKFLN